MSMFSLLKSAIIFSSIYITDQPLGCMGTHHAAAVGELTQGKHSHRDVTNNKPVTSSLDLSIYFSVFKIEKFLSVGTNMYIFLVTNNEQVT